MKLPITSVASKVMTATVGASSNVISAAVAFADTTIDVVASVMRANASGDQVLIYSWYQVDDASTANPAAVKLLEARHKLARRHRVSSRVYLATPLDGIDLAAGAEVLDQFVREHGEQLLTGLAATGEKE